MKYTAEFFKNTKIRIESEEHNKYVQGLAIECGYGWSCSTTGNYHKNVTYTDSPFLFFRENKVIGQCYTEYLFNMYDEYKEITIPMPEEAKYTEEFFKNTKIRIESEEHSKYVQELAFGCGYRWIANNQRIANTEEPFLYFDKDKEINYGNLEINFNEQNEEEIFIPMPEEEIKWPGDVRYTVRADKQFWRKGSCGWVNKLNGLYLYTAPIKDCDDFAERPHQTKNAKVSVCTRDDKYNRVITDREGNTAKVDVYDVIKAFNVTCPATQHAVKKLLCTGARGHKDKETDLKESIISIKRAVELHKVK